MNTVLRVLASLGLLVVGFVIGRETAPQPENFIGWYTVEAVIDGDTIKVNGQSIRYIGVDTPETKHPEKGVECFGPEASAKNTELVLGKRVQLDGDKRDKDKYGRSLRYVWLENGIFVNELLINDGYARFDNKYGRLKYGDKFARAQDEAKTRKLGMWGACKVEEKPAKKQKKGRK